MKKIFLILTLLVSVCAIAQSGKGVPARPNPPRLVNDFTNTLTGEQVQALEHKLVAYDDSTSNQVAVVIINTLEDNSLEDVSLGILRGWGVGGQGNNNGVVLLIVKDDRKVRIETGYGLEGAIPDITAKHIIDGDIVPAFKEGNFYRGIDEATNDIIKAAAGEYKAPKGYGSKGNKRGSGIGAIIFFIIILVLFAGRGGRGGGGMVSRRGYRGFGAGWILGTLLSGGGGGGGSGGGGWSGGGGGGGGFGGFGGGSGGGGGASGSW